MNKGLSARTPKPLKENVNLSFAIAYSQQLNYTIFPIYYKSKVPITKRGFHDASNDVEQIKEWFEKYPHAGIGLPTGKVNNVIAIDIDPRNGGMVSFERLVDEYAPFPHTVESLTGGNGFHKFFKYDERINKSSLKDYPGLDIQSDGKYVILPPSTHPNGRQYHWEDASKPIVTEMAELPLWFIELVSDRESHEKPKIKPTSHWVDVFNNTGEGNRNNNATSLAGHMLRRYIDPLLVREFMYLWNSEKVNPPLEEEELDTIINSVADMEIKRRNKREV